MQRNFEEPADIGIPLDQLAFIVTKARAYDAEVDPVDPDDGSNDADDRAVDVLEASRHNPNARELAGAIAALDEEAQANLVALVWIGRGDYEPEEWDSAREAARERHEGPTARYLLGIPLLGDLIEEGAARLNVSLTREEQLGMHNPITEQPAEEDRD